MDIAIAGQSSADVWDARLERAFSRISVRWMKCRAKRSLDLAPLASILKIDMVDVVGAGQGIAALGLPVFDGIVELLVVRQLEHVPLAVAVLGG